MKTCFRNNIRIIFAILAKDVVDAVKNKVTLSILLGTILLMLTSLAIPLLARLRDVQSAVAYDPGKSDLIRKLSKEDSFRLSVVDSQEEMDTLLTGSPVIWLGIVIPSWFGTASNPGSVVILDGYYAHWASRAKVAQRVAFFEEQLSQVVGQAVRIQTEGNAIYPSPESRFMTGTISISLVVVLLTIGMAITPSLIVEEKETHTFEALMVSPARMGQIVIGKALVGIFYCSCAAVVVFLFNYRMFVHWEVVILAVLLSATFAVGVGLLMGVIAENPATINLWMGLLLILMIIPVLIGLMDGAQFPEALQVIMPWIPTTAMVNLFHLGMAGQAPAAMIWKNAAILVASGFFLYVLTAWQVSRLSR